MYAIYARQSLDKKDSISIENQIDICKREIPADTQIKIYKDKGFSGKNIERPSFQKLLRDIEKGKINKIVIYRLDRMSRSLLDFAGLMETFNEYNVEFVSATEKFDTSTPIGRAMLSIVMVFAQLERETIADRIKDSYYERGKKGMYLGGTIPLGFDKKPYSLNGIKTSILIPNECMEIVLKMYDLYANSDLSLGKISEIFNSEGIKTLKGKSWDSAKISRTIKNPVYVKADADIYTYLKSLGCEIHNPIEEFDGQNGLYLFGDKVPTGKKNFFNIAGYTVSIAPHKGVVDSKTWLKCAKKLSNNKQIKNSGTSSHSWLSGLVSCGKCGYSMSINKACLSTKTNSYATYFRCSGRALKRICDAPAIRTQLVEDMVFEELKKKLDNISGKLKQEQPSSQKMNDLKIEIASKEQDIEKLIDSLLSANNITMEYINKRINKLNKELNTLNTELLEESAKEDHINTEEIINIKSLLPYWSKMTIEEKKDIAKATISRIRIDNKKCYIDWKF